MVSSVHHCRHATAVLVNDKKVNVYNFYAERIHISAKEWLYINLLIFWNTSVNMI